MENKSVKTHSSLFHSHKSVPFRHCGLKPEWSETFQMQVNYFKKNWRKETVLTMRVRLRSLAAVVAYQFPISCWSCAGVAKHSTGAQQRKYAASLLSSLFLPSPHSKSTVDIENHLFLHQFQNKEFSRKFQLGKSIWYSKLHKRFLVQIVWSGIIYLIRKSSTETMLHTC